MTPATTLKPLLIRAAIVMALVAAPLAKKVEAQERPASVVEGRAGWIGFADDGIVSEGLIGGGFRLYLLPRISVGPEIAYIQGRNHSHLALTGNITVDLLAARSGQPRRITPFVVVGAGLFQTREQFFGRRFTSSEGAFTAGGGVSALVSERVTLGAEARVGWELHFRLNGTVGVRLGR